MKLKAVIDKLNDTRTRPLSWSAKQSHWHLTRARSLPRPALSGKDVLAICKEAGITEEVGKRYEKVAATQRLITNGDADPSLMRQTYLRIGILPDPITTSEPQEPKPFLFPMIKVRQWLASRGLKFISQDKGLREQFLAEAEPIVQAYNDLKGAG
jgi:hypothetical protein